MIAPGFVPYVDKSLLFRLSSVFIQYNSFGYWTKGAHPLVC